MAAASLPAVRPSKRSPRKRTPVIVADKTGGDLFAIIRHTSPGHAEILLVARQHEIESWQASYRRSAGKEAFEAIDVVSVAWRLEAPGCVMIDDTARAAKRPGAAIMSGGKVIKLVEFNDAAAHFCDGFNELVVGKQAVPLK